MPPRATLVSKTEYPVETLWAVWFASKSDDPIPPVDELAGRRMGDPDFNEQMEDLFHRMLVSFIPVVEVVSFTFLLEDVTIAFREQMVRHRIGTKVGPRTGVDILPDLADSTWWIQSTRCLDMRSFPYHLPASVREAGPEAVGWYEQHMRRTSDLYEGLVAKGVPVEDARELVPLGTRHRLTWTLNLQALKHIVSKRSCWILQLGHWGPIIRDMVRELSTKVSPLFAKIVTPPCIDPATDEFKGCVALSENDRRLVGLDELPPCPLFLHHHHEQAHRIVVDPESVDPDHPRDLDRGKCWQHAGSTFKGDHDHWAFVAPTQWEAKMYVDMRARYGKFWNRNVDTGEFEG